MTARPIYDYTPHHRTRGKLDSVALQVEVSGQLPSGNALVRFNAWLVVEVTNGVGTMWRAYAFAALVLVSLPAAVDSHSGAVTLVSWVSQTFLQLVLLSVVIVVQNELARTADKRAEATYNDADADAALDEVVKLQEHLLAQDRVLQEVLGDVATS